jgi:hypothetical protein
VRTLGVNYTIAISSARYVSPPENAPEMPSHPVTRY